MNIMIVVPHPDDEVLGFGGVIQQHIKNKDNVTVYFISKPITQRLKEQINQCKKIGRKLGHAIIIKEIELTDEHFRECVGYLEKEIETFKPDILYSVFYGDNHQDHEFIFKIVKTATRIYSNFLVKKIYLGEILSSTDQSPKLPQYAFTPTYYVPLTRKQVEKKIKCMEYYKNEIQQWPHPRSARTP